MAYYPGVAHPLTFELAVWVRRMEEDVESRSFEWNEALATAPQRQIVVAMAPWMGGQSQLDQSREWTPICISSRRIRIVGWECNGEITKTCP
jgi:hypothetical protein